MCLFVCCPIKEVSCLTKLVHRRQNQGSNIQLARAKPKAAKGELSCDVGVQRYPHINRSLNVISGKT